MAKKKKIEGKTAKEWCNIGDDLNGLGRNEEAIECYDKALKIEPKCERARRNREFAEKKLREKNIKDAILYVPEKTYERDLTIIKRQDILVKYQMMKNNDKLNEISNYIYLKYRSFGFINLNFLKRKIYEFI